MEGALAAKTVMIVALVAHCGAVPTASSSQEQLSKAKVNLSKTCSNIALLFVIKPADVRERTVISFSYSVKNKISSYEKEK